MNSQKSRPLIVGLGQLLWDMLPAGKKLGGAPANFTYHANALGADGVIVSAVGRDSLGEEALAQLDRKKLNREFVASLEDWKTGTVAVTLSGDGVPQYTMQDGVAWDHIPLTPETLRMVSEADAICYGSLAQRSETSRKTIRALLDAASSDCLLVCDINLRQDGLSRDFLSELLEPATVLKLNDGELAYIARLFDCRGTVREQLDSLRRTFALDLVALTRGPGGSILLTATECVDHPGIAALEIVDTVGAGDAFAAALIVGLLRGDSLDGIGDHANRLAAQVCAQDGAMPDSVLDGEHGY